jgi:septum site-determining protein MinC
VNSLTPIKKDGAAPAQKKGIRFPARSFLAFALAPEAPLEEWLQGLDHWTENSPGFFAGRPVVLDLNLLKPQPDEVAALVAQLAERGIRVYAIEAAAIDHLDPELPPLLKGTRPAMIDEPQAEQRRSQNTASANAMIIESPVRSGQAIFNPDGDVIVLGSAGSGSEIVAAGSIHIYGTLRGRAFAGATGNTNARIFCRKNEAELLAVDGWYETADDMEPETRGRPIQVLLEENRIRVTAL